MFHWKKGLALLTIGALTASSLTGCGLLQGVASAVKEAVEETEAESETPADTEETGGNTETPQTAEETPAPTTQTSSDAPMLAKRFTVAYESAPDYGACLVTGRCESPVLADISEEQYPALAAALEAYTEQEIKNYDENITSLKEQAEMEYQENPERFKDGMYYTSDLTVLPQRVDDKVVSFFSSASDFTGGAHGMYGLSGKTFDTQTGEELVLTDVLSDLSNLTELIKGELLANYDPELFDDLDEALSCYDVAVTEVTATADNDLGYVYPYNWALTPNGVAFYFGPYALAPYAAGDQMVTLSYEAYPDLFKPDYLPGENAGCMIPFTWELTGCDIDGDGKPNTITMDYDYDENYEERLALRITVDGMGSAATEEGAFSTDYDVMGYYARTADGRQYVYVTEDMESDYQQWYVFDLNGAEVKASGTTGFVRAVREEEDQNLTELMLTDPDHMILGNKFDFLCSFVAVREYAPGKDGMPVPDDPYFYVYNNCAQEPLVAKTTLGYTVLDQNGNATGEKGEISPGDTFTVVRTDGESVLDVVLSDGSLVRLTITDAASPCKIDGITDEDCVEQLWYAG